MKNWPSALCCRVRRPGTRELVLRINQEVIRTVNLPDVKEKLFQLGLDMQPGTPEALDALIKTETIKWAKVVKESGAKID